MFLFVSVNQTGWALVLFGNIINDIKLLLKSPIPRWSDNQISEEVMLRQRINRLNAQRIGIYLGNTLCATGAMLSLFSTLFFSALLYMLSIVYFLWAFKTPFQLHNEISKGNSTQVFKPQERLCWWKCNKILMTKNASKRSVKEVPNPPLGRQSSETTIVLD